MAKKLKNVGFSLKMYYFQIARLSLDYNAKQLYVMQSSYDRPLGEDSRLKEEKSNV